MGFPILSSSPPSGDSPGFLKDQLLKQTSPARRKIGLGEDLPQGVLMVVFALRQGNSIFLIAAIAFSLLRLLLCSKLVGGQVNKYLIKEQVSKFNIAISAGNVARALTTAAAIWSIDQDRDQPRLKELVEAAECKD